MLQLRNMLTFEEFIRTPRCKQLVLPPEDQPQDERDWKKLLRADQERQYDVYASQFEPKEREDVAQQPLTVLRNNVKSRAEYFRKYRKKPKFCPHCKKQL